MSIQGGIMERWIPLTQYAMESGISISTLRRKIKSNSIAYKLDNGKYLIRSETEAGTSFEIKNEPSSVAIFETAPVRNKPIAIATQTSVSNNFEMELRWKALEARVNGLAKKVDYLIEQNSELNMLVKVFEEKLNASF